MSEEIMLATADVAWLSRQIGELTNMIGLLEAERARDQALLRRVQVYLLQRPTSTPAARVLIDAISDALSPTEESA